MVKARTTIRIDEGIISFVKDSNVRNMSKYIDNLSKELISLLSEFGTGERKLLTINIDERINKRVRDLGIGSAQFSAVIQMLMLFDLKKLKKGAKHEDKKIAKLYKELEGVREEWKAYARSESRKGNPEFPKELCDR